MKHTRFAKLRRIAQSDPVGLDQAIAAGLGEAHGRFVEARAWEASYFADCPRVPAGGSPHPGACEPSGGGDATPLGEFELVAAARAGEPINVRLYSGQGDPQKLDAAPREGTARYGRDGKYYTDVKSAAEQYAEFRPGGHVVVEDVRLEKPFIDVVYTVERNGKIVLSDDSEKRLARPEYKKLDELLAEEGLPSLRKLDGSRGKYGEYLDGFTAGAQRLAQKHGDSGGPWSGADRMQKIIRAAGFDGIVGSLRDLPDLPNHTEVLVFRDDAKRESLREAQAPRTKAKLDAKKRPAIADVVADMGDNFDDIAGELMDGEGPNPLLAAQIDRNLGVGIWTGSTFEDRTTHAVEGFARNLVSDIETSLLAQESYGDFEARLFKKMGITDSSRNLGTLAQFDALIRGEANLAWNEAMIAANADTDTALVWECQMKPTSTPGCIWRHGRTIDELSGETPLRHTGCGCFVTTIPDPDSDDPDRAEAGRAVLSQMAAEREEAGGGDEFEESAKPSRFQGLRRLAEADSYFKDCPRTPAGGEPHPGACAASDGGDTGDRDPNAYYDWKGNRLPDDDPRVVAAKSHETPNARIRPPETPEFREWFSGSKVVDEKGVPLVLFHGSGHQIDAFDTTGDAEATGNVTAVWGSFFTSDPAEAARYASDFHQSGHNITPVFLALRNPYEMTRSEWDKHAIVVFKKQRTQDEAVADERAFRRSLIAQGHDGIVVKGRGHNAEYVAFHPEQIKSVFNKGTFDPKSPKISESAR